jgi:hypothetical protein
VCLDRQLIPSSFEHTVNYLIDQFDLSRFDAAFHNDQLGAPAYPPDVMLKIVFYRTPISVRPLPRETGGSAGSHRPEIRGLRWSWG